LLFVGLFSGGDLCADEEIVEKKGIEEQK